MLETKEESQPNGQSQFAGDQRKAATAWLFQCPEFTLLTAGKCNYQHYLLAT